jgi:aspartate aminotransferase-like enzyme
MSNYPNMSYCMCENTLLALRQVLDAMEDQGTEFVQDMSRNERRAFEELFHACEAFMQQAEQLEEDAAEQNNMIAENDYED